VPYFIVAEPHVGDFILQRAHPTAIFSPSCLVSLHEQVYQPILYIDQEYVLSGDEHDPSVLFVRISNEEGHRPFRV
jgi:hypothetical protein